MTSYVNIAAALLEDGPALFVEWEGREPERYSIPALTKKSALRFAVGEPGYRGTIWRLWGSANADDVYLASRNRAHEFKVSLHESGDWRLQAVDLRKDNDTHFGDLIPEQGRIIHRWTRPQADEAGWTRAVMIRTPSEHLASIPDDRVKYEDVRWIQAPPAGYTLYFEVVLVQLDAERAVIRTFNLEPGDSAAVIDTIQLPGGEVVLVLAFAEVTPPDALDELDAQLQRYAASESAPPDTWDQSPGSGPRSLLSHDDEGMLVLSDLASAPLR